MLYLFGESLKRARNNKKLSQISLGKLLSVSQQTVASWEINRTSPSPEMIKKISEVLRVSTNELLGVGEKKSSESTEEKEDKELLDKTLNELLEQQDGILFFEGKPLDDETKELLIASLKNTIQMAKKMNKDNNSNKH